MEVRNLQARGGTHGSEAQAVVGMRGVELQTTLLGWVGVGWGGGGGDVAAAAGLTHLCHQLGQVGLALGLQPCQRGTHVVAHNLVPRPRQVQLCTGTQGRRTGVVGWLVRGWEVWVVGQERTESEGRLAPPRPGASQRLAPPLHPHCTHSRPFLCLPPPLTLPDLRLVGDEVVVGGVAVQPGHKLGQRLHPVALLSTGRRGRAGGSGARAGRGSGMGWVQRSAGPARPLQAAAPPPNPPTPHSRCGHRSALLRSCRGP